jgi:ParB family chromosome partitioning protein
MKTQTIAIKSIALNGGNRQSIDQAKLKELAASIKKHGLINAIAVHATTKGRYDLIAGERRIKAHELLGIKAIEAKVYTNLSDSELREIRAVENLQREDLSCWEEAEQLAELRVKTT